MTFNPPKSTEVWARLSGFRCEDEEAKPASWPMPAWTPVCAKNGQWSGKIKMSRRGSVALHTALYQAASMARLYDHTLHFAPEANLTILQEYALSPHDSLLLV